MIRVNKKNVFMKAIWGMYFQKNYDDEEIDKEQVNYITQNQYFSIWRWR